MLSPRAAIFGRTQFISRKKEIKIKHSKFFPICKTKHSSAICHRANLSRMLTCQSVGGRGVIIHSHSAARRKKNTPSRGKKRRCLEPPPENENPLIVVRLERERAFRPAHTAQTNMSKVANTSSHSPCVSNRSPPTRFSSHFTFSPSKPKRMMFIMIST